MAVGVSGFTSLLEWIEGSVRTILVETANRFARDLIVQEVGYAMLKDRGINLIAADNPSSPPSTSAIAIRSPRRSQDLCR